MGKPLAAATLLKDAGIYSLQQIPLLAIPGWSNMAVYSALAINCNIADLLNCATGTFYFHCND